MIPLQAGKLNLLLDGQFGSTGKGLLANFIGMYNHVDLAISNASSNAGHTFYRNFFRISDRKVIVKHLPISGILNDRSLIYLCAGSIINPTILKAEIDENNIDPDRIAIHPRAAVIETQDLETEALDAGVKRIASTMSGVGSALVRKINRNARLACDTPELQPYVKEINVHQLLKDGCTALMEVPQGLDLSINHGFSYPYCTSRDITPSAALNDAGVHPKFLGTVAVAIRTLPIRVGNVVENGKELGFSGPFFPDSVETTWKKLKLETEYTTRTNRVRRVATFSLQQYRRMLSIMQPDYVFLNFCNYLKQRALESLLAQLPEVTHLGFGATIEDVRQRPSHRSAAVATAHRVPRVSFSFENNTTPTQPT